LGVYLITVVIQGNSEEFIHEIGNEKGFIKFGGSILTLVILRDLLGLGAIGTAFINLAILAMFFNIVGSDNGQSFLTQINDLTK
jgi:hypothetical protein